MNHLFTFKVLLIGCIAMLADAVTAEAQTTVVDKLTKESFLSEGSYTPFTGVSITSTAIYAGNTSTSYKAIQLTTSSSNKGIVTTSSGGTVRKITIVWNINTASGRTLSIYAKNSAYLTNPSGLYDTGKGTLIADVKFNTKDVAQTNVVEVPGNYTYIGIRSKSDALYIDTISIEWEVPEAGAPDMPVITPAAGTLFDNTQKVTITSADGTTIWYTTDGTEPAVDSGTHIDSSTVTFSIGETTTVKAIAVNEDGKVSEVTSAYYTKVESSTGLSALVAKIRGDESSSDITYYVRLTDAVVTGVYDRYAYIEENGTAIYLNQSGHTLKVGQQYSGLATVSAKMTSSQPQLTAFDCPTVVEGATLPLTTVTLAELAGDFDTYLYRRVKVEDATVTKAFEDRRGKITQGDVTKNVYAQGGADIIMAVNDVIDVVAFPNRSSGTQQLNVLSREDITVKTVAPVLYFSESAISVRVDGDVSEPELTNTYGEEATYTSAEEAVATVDVESGEVTIVGVGETIITASLPTLGKSVSYTLTVVEVPVFTKTNGNYYLVTSTKELVVGARYLIANNSNGMVMGWQKSDNRGISSISTLSDDKREISSVTLATSDASTDDEKAREFVLEEGTKKNTWSFHDKIEAGYLYAPSSSSNHMRTKQDKDANASATIEIDAADGNATIKFQGSNTRNWIRYNSTSTLFSCYASGQYDIQLYKLYDTGSFTIGTDGYASFYTDKAFVMPEGVEGAIITEVTDYKLSIEYRYTSGAIVPAKTALLLKGSAGEYVYDHVTSTASAPDGNLLYGANAVDSEGNTYVAGMAVKYYRLSKKGGKNLGFYWGAADGAAFAYQAGKSFLAIDFEDGSRAYSIITLDDMVTGIHDVEATQVGGSRIYTLTGVCVGTDPRVLPKGIYVVNGKKVAF